MSSIPGQGTKITHVAGQLSPYASVRDPAHPRIKTQKTTVKKNYYPSFGRPGDEADPWLAPWSSWMEFLEFLEFKEGDPWSISEEFPLLTDSVQFSCLVMSDSLQPHRLQHARPPWPSPRVAQCSYIICNNL